MIINNIIRSSPWRMSVDSLVALASTAKIWNYTGWPAVGQVVGDARCRSGYCMLRKELQNLYADSVLILSSRARKQLSWWQPWVGSKGLVVEELVEDLDHVVESR